MSVTIFHPSETLDIPASLEQLYVGISRISQPSESQRVKKVWVKQLTKVPVNG